jgi:hypothetical protein
MDKVSPEMWERMVADIQKVGPEKRKHFAQMVMTLAKCYIDDFEHKAIVLIDAGDSLLTFCAGADEMEMADMLIRASELANAVTMADAPPKEMFN